MGTSDESTAGGVVTLYGQLAGAALGSAPGSARATGSVSGMAIVAGPQATKPAATRHDIERRKLIVCAH